MHAYVLRLHAHDLPRNTLNLFLYSYQLLRSIAMQHQLLTPKQAAESIGVTQGFLTRDRCTTARIPFLKLGHKTIRYRQEDLNSFLNSILHTSTSSYQNTPIAVGA